MKFLLNTKNSKDALKITRVWTQKIIIMFLTNILKILIIPLFFYIFFKIILQTQK